MKNKVFYWSIIALLIFVPTVISILIDNHILSFAAGAFVGGIISEFIPFDKFKRNKK